MSFAVVLFDLDGTLINTNDLIVRSFQHTLKELLELDVPTEAIYKHFGEPLITSMARYSPERAAELTQFYRTFNQANHDTLVSQFEGVVDSLERLKAAGVKLGVVTSKFRDLALRGLRVCGLENYFDTVVGMDETERHKPDPQPIQLALERLGEKPGDHVLMVGDSVFDLLCGHNAGVKTAAVRWTVIDQAALAQCKPDYWIDRPADLGAVGLAQ